nr:hypothetical protein [Tanacetum cinerariifolium]
MTTTTTTTFMTDAQLKALIELGIANALAARDADRSRNGKDSHDSRMGTRRQAHPARECTYQDFMKCKPLYFKGTEGVVELTQWFKRMEIVFRISNCSVENQIKFATCTLLAGRPEKEDDIKSPANANNNQRGTKTSQKPTCYECGSQGYYMSDCPELKNQNHGNQAECTGAHGMVHALRGGETNQDLNNMEDDINS